MASLGSITPSHGSAQRNRIEFVLEWKTWSLSVRVGCDLVLLNLSQSDVFKISVVSSALIGSDFQIKRLFFLRSRHLILKIDGTVKWIRSNYFGYLVYAFVGLVELGIWIIRLYFNLNSLFNRFFLNLKR